MTRLVQTPSQTVGPFFSIGLCRERQNELSGGTAGAERIRIAGVVLDGAGAPVPDAMLEVWHPSIGFGRAATNPQADSTSTWPRPPHVNVDRSRAACCTRSHACICQTRPATPKTRCCSR